MHARAQKLAVTFPGKENGEAHKAAVKTKPAFTPRTRTCTSHAQALAHAHT